MSTPVYQHENHIVSRGVPSPLLEVLPKEQIPTWNDIKVPAKPSVPPKTKFPVHFNLEYMLQKVFKMTEVKLTIAILLQISIYWYQSTNRRFIHSHKGAFTIGLILNTPPPIMRMYKQIRKLNLKFHLKKVIFKISAISWNSYLFIILSFYNFFISLFCK